MLQEGYRQRLIPTVKKTRRPGDPPALIAAAGKIRNEPGWYPCHQDIRNIIESVLAWKSKFPFEYQGSSAPSPL
ncbi:UDP-glucose 4-epimerase [Candidatus Xiphinematobacter sp. Idaho Grape]|nr:UDP-glucose 4-epimerase [Candidatus Xiphinematobacter sp. Idaho Grape]